MTCASNSCHPYFHYLPVLLACAGLGSLIGSTLGASFGNGAFPDAPMEGREILVEDSNHTSDGGSFAGAALRHIRFLK